jgi:hypothetical protein
MEKEKERERERERERDNREKVSSRVDTFRSQSTAAV